MYQFILLHTCDYLNKISRKKNVWRDEGNSRKEIGHCTKDDIGVAVQSCL